MNAQKVSPRRTAQKTGGPDAAALPEGRAKILEWQHLTGRAIDALDRTTTIVIVSCSPLEVHGPHLPTITDNIEGDGLLRRGCDYLAERFPELTFLRLPGIYVAADVLPQPGSLMFRSSTVTRVMEDLGRSLCKQGFKHIWVGNFHGGPRHFVPIEIAADRVNRRYGGRMVSVFSLLIKQLTGGSSDLRDILGDIEGIDKADLEGDSHGGLVETSMMLHLIGEHVDPIYKELAQQTVDLKLQAEGKPPLAPPGKIDFGELMRGFKVKLKYYETESYAGQPSAASAEIGAQILDRLSKLAADSLADVYTGKLPLHECHSPVWPAREIFMNRALNWGFERAMRYKNRVF